MSLDTRALKDSRAMVADVIEDVGAACTHLREACDFAEAGSTVTAVASDRKSVV